MRQLAVLMMTVAWLTAVGDAGAQAAQPQVASAASATLAGTVYDPQGKPAEHLLLTLIGRESDVSVNARADAAGHYQFTPVPPINATSSPRRSSGARNRRKAGTRSTSGRFRTRRR